MRICIVSAYPPQKGNLAEYAYYLTNELVKNKKVSKIIILANKSSEAKNEEEVGKIRIIRCWKTNSLFLPIPILWNIKKHNPDLVFFNCHMMSWGKGKVVNFLGALLPTIVKKFLGYKVVVTLHNIVEAADLKELGIKPSRITLFGSYLATKSLLSADRVIVTLRSFVSLLGRKYGKTNFVHIPHGTLGRKLESAKTGGKTIMTFGFWRENKNLPLLIEVFKELRKEDKKLKLIVAGTSHPNFPGYLEKVKGKYAKVKNILFTGYVPEDELDKVFLSSTVVVLPYTTATGTSGVIHLAASYGKPVIVTDLAEMREIMKEEKISLILVPKNDKRALLHAIRRVVNDEKLQKTIGNRNLRAAERLSFFNISKEYIRVFEEVLKSKATSR